MEEYPGESTTRHVALDKHDDRAAIILYNALINESLPYSLFLAYFGDVDARGHQYGASSQKYLSAIENKTEIVRK